MAMTDENIEISCPKKGSEWRKWLQKNHITKQSINEEKYMQFFSRRKPNSTWSKINKTKI